MQHRGSELTAFLTSLHGAITARTQVGSDVRLVTDKIMQALQTELPAASPNAAWLPVCELLNESVATVVARALQNDAEHPSQIDSAVVRHAQALRALSPQLAWWHRSDARLWGEPFASGHANATIIGAGGLEEREDVWVGVSLVAPDIQYPEHHHPPEEVYLVMSRGDWQKQGGAWDEPGIGGLVHNPPGIRHAMRSGSMPLLATWCLWNGLS